MSRAVDNERRSDPQVARGVRVRLAQVAIAVPLYAALPFTAAGSLKWPAAWALVAI